MDTQTTTHATPIDPAFAAGAIAAGQVPADTRADGPAGARIAAALVKAQAGFRAAKKTAANPFFRSKYATLAEVWEAVAPALTEAGIAVIQPISVDAAGGIFVDTTLLHISGESLSCRCPVLCKERDNPQAMGSAITYARRYSLSAMLGVVTEDDDGEAAMGRGKAHGSAPKAPPPTPAPTAPAPTAQRLADAPTRTPTPQDVEAIKTRAAACADSAALSALWNADDIRDIRNAAEVKAVFVSRGAFLRRKENSTQNTKKD